MSLNKNDLCAETSRALTISLLGQIGSPLVSERLPISDTRSSVQLYAHAINNKIPLLYLESLKQQGKLTQLASEYEEQSAKYRRFVESVARVSRILDDASIQYVTFKTVKPYLGMGGDIDILVLGQDKMYKQAVKALIKANYTSAVLHEIVDRIAPMDENDYDLLAEKLTDPTYGIRGHISPTGTDLVDNESGIQVDLQHDIAMSHLVYFDKSKFSGCIMEAHLAKGQKTKVLTPELDLATVIAHSAMEQIYLLGEYYTFLFHLSRMNEQGIMEFISVVKANKLKVATMAFTTISSELHKEAFGVIPSKLGFILDNLGFSASEAKTLWKNNFKMPHKYKVSTVARVFLEKLGEQRFRQSVPAQIIRTLNPKLARLVVHDLIHMRRRETYLKGG